MQKIKHRLIFSFYLTDDFEDNFANKIHFKMLRYYQDRFDEAIFCINIDNVDDVELIKRFEKKILSIGYIRNVDFKIYENTLYREAYVFKHEIIDSLKELDGLTFFGHNKGYTNGEHDWLKKWIVGCYFLALNDISDVDNQMIDSIYSERKIFYGSFLVKQNDPIDYGEFQYLGTFYWLNGQGLYEYCKKNEIEIPLLTNRSYAEIFPSRICCIGQYLNGHVGSFDYRYLLNCNIMTDVDFMLKYLTNNVYNDFLKIYNDYA